MPASAFKKDAVAAYPWILALTTSTPVTTIAYFVTRTPPPDNPATRSVLSIAVINVIRMQIATDTHGRTQTIWFERH